MLRPRFPHVLMLVLTLAACGKEKTPVPQPEPPTPAKAETTAHAVTTAAPPPEASTAPTAEALASAKADAPDHAKAKDPTPAPANVGAAEVQLPKTKNGVLVAGAADKVLPLGAAPIIRLLDAGAEPRSDLSYALSKGTSQKIQMAMDVVMAMKMGAKSMPAASIPQVIMALDMATTDKNPKGDWKIDSRLTQLSVNPKGAQQDQIAKAMRPQLDGMKGLGMGYWINSKGNVRDFKLDVPKSFPAASEQMLQGMNQSFESMVAPLPVEAVGLGARWQVVSRIASAGADLLQSATYTLKSRSGSKATLDVALVQLSATETISPPGMPAGVSAHMKSFSSSGTGTSQLDTSSIAPDAGTVVLKTAMTITLDAATDETSVETTTKVAMSRP